MECLGPEQVQLITMYLLYLGLIAKNRAIKGLVRPPNLHSIRKFGSEIHKKNLKVLKRLHLHGLKSI